MSTRYAHKEDKDIIRTRETIESDIRKEYAEQEPDYPKDQLDWVVNHLIKTEWTEVK